MIINVAATDYYISKWNSPVVAMLFLCNARTDRSCDIIVKAAMSYNESCLISYIFGDSDHLFCFHSDVRFCPSFPSDVVSKNRIKESFNTP